MNSGRAMTGSMPRYAAFFCEYECEDGILTYGLERGIMADIRQLHDASGCARPAAASICD